MQAVEARVLGLGIVSGVAIDVMQQARVVKGSQLSRI